MAGQEEDMQSSSKDSGAEVTVLKEELQLVVKKEREAQVSVRTPATIAAILLLLFLRSLCLCFAEGAGRAAFILGHTSGHHGES